jgi:hypothetical protein
MMEIGQRLIKMALKCITLRLLETLGALEE